MRGAAALMLREHRDAGANPSGLGGDLVLPWPDDHGSRTDAGLGNRGQHMREERFTGERMKHLGPCRAHADALASRKHDRKAVPNPHRNLRAGRSLSREFGAGKYLKAGKGGQNTVANGRIC